jgi:hypothetical protein
MITEAKLSDSMRAYMSWQDYYADPKYAKATSAAISEIIGFDFSKYYLQALDEISSFENSSNNSERTNTYGKLKEKTIWDYIVEYFKMVTYHILQF